MFQSTLHYLDSISLERSMPPTLKRNAVLVVCLAFAFWWAFMFFKHDPVLGLVIPFGKDPYDAVGSFAALGAVFIGVLSVFRAFRPARIGPTAPQLIYLVRTEAAVVLCVLIACAADGIALARHIPEWIHAGARLRILAILITLVVTSIGLLAIVRSPAETHRSASGPRTLRTAAICVAAALVLASYPERAIENPIAHLVTILIGALLLFGPMAALVVALIPAPVREDEPSAEMPRRRPRRYAVGLVLSIGVLIGSFAFLGEMTEGGGAAPPARKLVAIAAVFIALTTGAVAIAYLCIGRPLGIRRS